MEIEEIEKLVYSIIHKYFRDYPYKEDLFQVGYIGYMKAEENYDSSYETKLSTYAYPFIYGEMRKFLREDHSIKISRELILLSSKIEKVTSLLKEKLKREPTIEELSKILGISKIKILEAKLSLIPPRSIDERINVDGKEMTLHDTIPDKGTGDIDLLIALKEELLSLSKEERRLIQYRYMNEHTQTETAKYLGISQVQVSRNEAKVLKKLRSRLN